MKLDKRNARDDQEDMVINIIRNCRKTNQYLAGLPYKEHSVSMNKINLQVIAPEGTTRMQCEQALREGNKDRNVVMHSILTCPPNWFRKADVMCDIDKYYPEAVTVRYSKLRPAYLTGDNYQYAGPHIKTAVHSIGVQHYAIYAEPEHKMLNEFISSDGSDAFNKAVAYADQFNLPWKLSDGADYFDPGSGVIYTVRYY